MTYKLYWRYVPIASKIRMTGIMMVWIYCYMYNNKYFHCRHCGIPDPSWAELRHFVFFLNTQLVDFEKSDFLSNAAARDLPGFSQFVLRFLIQMSRVFFFYMYKFNYNVIWDRRTFKGEQDFAVYNVLSFFLSFLMIFY